MSKKKPYKRYQEDPFVKAPALAWLMDRPKAMLPVIGVGLLGVGTVLSMGWQSYESIAAPLANDSPYAEVQAVASNAKSWIVDIAEAQPPTVNTWEVSENYRGRHIIDGEHYVNAVGQELPESLLLTSGAIGDGVTFRAQAYGAGQGAKAFEQILATMEEYTDYEPTVENVSQSKIARFADGFIINAGDGIVGVVAEDVDMLDELETFYVPQVESSISASDCARIHPRSDDYMRSFFYNQEEYTGLLEQENIVTEVNFSNLPTPASLQLLQVENPNAIAPEAPLPESFKDLPDDRERPGLQPRPETRDSFEKIAEYQIEDSTGPGCGWEWTAHTQPVHDLDAMLQEQQHELDTTQQAVNTTTREYISTQQTWALQMAANMPTINQWNRHVNRVNSIHEQWEELRTARNEIRTEWYNWAEAHDDWREFPVLQREAREDYTEAVEICETAQEELEEWEDEYGNAEEEQREAYIEELEAWEERQAEREEEERRPEPSPSPSDDESGSPSDDESSAPESPSPSPTPSPSDDPRPTFEPEDIPERPEGCDTPPERPAILDEDRGDEPQQPTIPENVTIPNSWPKSEDAVYPTDDTENEDTGSVSE